MATPEPLSRGRRRRPARLAGWLALTVLTALAAVMLPVGESPASAVRAIVAPGQDELIAVLVAKGIVLPGGCKFDGGTAAGEAIRAEYACEGRDIEIELRHPDAAAADAPRSAAFAIVTRRGPLPDGFTDALLAHLRTNEGAFVWQQEALPPVFDPAAYQIAPLLAPALAVLALLMFGADAYVRMRRSGARAREIALLLLRCIGMAAILASALQATESAGAEGAAGIVALGAFLWLVATGYFGFGSADRGDWVGLIPFAVALVLREVFTLHSIQEVEIAFLHRGVDKHSAVYPLLQRLFLPLVSDQHVFTMHMNGVLGSLACLALYLFARQRLESRPGGMLVALFLAIDPMVTRFAPTDGQYSFLLASWFGGLALLSAPRLDGRALIGGATLLALAVTSRIEGATFLIASALMLDPRKLIDAMRRNLRATAVALLVGAGLVAVHMSAVLGQHLGQVPTLPRAFGVLWPLQSPGHVFTALLGLGALSGVLIRRWLGLGTAIGAMIVLTPVAESNFPTGLHRYVPACALLALTAGVGAYALTAWLPLARRRPLLAALPGVGLAGVILVTNRDVLTHSYVFNEQYAIVRAHLAQRQDCTLLVFLASDDADVHDYGQALPEMRVVDCGGADCIAIARQEACVYYLRSSSGYQSTPDACGAGNQDSGCLTTANLYFEQGVRLTPVEVRTLDLRASFGKSFPRQAEIGLFRVHPD